MPEHGYHLAWTIARCVAGLLGFTFLYMALFMYQDERGRQQNRLLDLWLAVQAREESTVEQYATFIRRSSEIVLIGLRELFGEKLLAARVIAISFALSVCSAIILLELIHWHFVNALPFFASAIASAFYAFVLGPRLFRANRKVLAWIALAAFCFIPTVVAFWYDVLHDNSAFPGVPLPIIGAISCLFGIVCDLLLLVVNRRIIQAMVKTTSIRLLLAGLAYNLLWAVVLADSLRFLFLQSMTSIDPLSYLVFYLIESDYPYHVYSMITLQYAFSTNLFTLLVAASVLIIAMIAIVHRLVWPIVGRSINAFYQWEIMSSRKVQFSAATAFLLFSIPRLSTVFALFK